MDCSLVSGFFQSITNFIVLGYGITTLAATDSFFTFNVIYSCFIERTFTNMIEKVAYSVFGTYIKLIDFKWTPTESGDMLIVFFSAEYCCDGDIKLAYTHREVCLLVIALSLD